MILLLSLLIVFWCVPYDVVVTSVAVISDSILVQGLVVVALPTIGLLIVYMYKYGIRFELRP